MWVACVTVAALCVVLHVEHIQEEGVNKQGEGGAHLYVTVTLPLKLDVLQLWLLLPAQGMSKQLDTSGQKSQQF